MEQIASKLVDPKKKVKIEKAATAIANTYMAVIQDYVNGNLKLGAGCIQMTKEVAEFKCSAHVLPGLISDTMGNPLIAIIGPTKAAVRAAVLSLVGDEADSVSIAMVTTSN